MTSIEFQMLENYKITENIEYRNQLIEKTLPYMRSYAIKKSGLYYEDTLQDFVLILITYIEWLDPKKITNPNIWAIWAGFKQQTINYFAKKGRLGAISEKEFDEKYGSYNKISDFSTIGEDLLKGFIQTLRQEDRRVFSAICNIKEKQKDRCKDMRVKSPQSFIYHKKRLEKQMTKYIEQNSVY